ncbi:hypothetical protein AB0H43_32290 [Hamadaea sp. NPDC050747]|uniref:hypothetical protein n=1 Tax=Hamadaea sp. NPDC050747 TaxID=3155789 RepID=UPI0033FE355A
MTRAHLQSTQERTMPRGATLPALLAATSVDAQDGAFYGPQWPGNAGGPPGEQKPWGTLRDPDAAARLWSVSEQLTGVTFA